MADTATLPAEPRPKSFLARVVGVFWSPGETFAGIAAKPDWVAPLILLTVVSVATVETMLGKIGIERIVSRQMELSGQAARLSADQLQRAIQLQVTIGGIITHIAGVLGPAIGLLIFAAIGLLIVNAFFGSKAGFKKVFSVTCYASLPGILGSLMMMAVILFGDPEHFNPSSPAPTTLGFFLDPQTTSRPVLALANSLNIFTIWFLILISIGLSAATERKVKTAHIFMVYLGAWLLWTLAMAGLAMLTA